MFRNFKMISRVVFGRGCFDQLDDILFQKRNKTASLMVFLIDDVFMQSKLSRRIPVQDQDLVLWVNVDDEPKTEYVDELTNKVKAFCSESSPNHLPDGLIGIGAEAPWTLPKRFR